MFKSAFNLAYVVYTKTVFHLSVGGNVYLVIGVLRHQFFACLLYLCHFIVVIFSPLKMYFIGAFEMVYHVLKCVILPILWRESLVFQEKYCIWNSSYGEFASFVNVCWKLLVDMRMIWRQVKNLFILLIF